MVKTLNTTVSDDKSAALDAALFPRYKAAYVDILNVVAPDPDSVARARERFLSDEIENPTFTYHQQRSVDYAANAAALQQLAADIESDRSLPEPVVVAYRGAITEQLQVIAIAQALQEYSATGDGERFAAELTPLVTEIYGRPRLDTFNDIFGRFQAEFTESSRNHESPAARRLQELTTGYVRSLHPPHMPPPADIRDGTGVCTKSTELAAAFREGFSVLGITDWSVMVSAYASTIRVVPSAGCIWIPNDSELSVRAKPLTPNAVLGLIAHEIGTHVLRQVRGATSSLQLLSLGLAGYEAGEEGLAMYREQQYTGLADFAGVDGYLAAGLAEGLDGHVPRTYREVFTILVDYFSVVRQVDRQTARILAWQRCLRTFRGTPGDIRGCIFTKDIVYRDGNIATWLQMQDGTFDDLDLDRGKFDQTNSEHRALLCELARISH